MKVTVVKDFSSTVFGNVVAGQTIELTEEKAAMMKSRGLIDYLEVDISSMTKKELEKFCKDKFDIDLDLRMNVDKLRDEVAALLEVM